MWSSSRQLSSVRVAPKAPNKPKLDRPYGDGGAHPSTPSSVPWLGDHHRRFSRVGHKWDRRKKTAVSAKKDRSFYRAGACLVETGGGRGGEFRMVRQLFGFAMRVAFVVVSSYEKNGQLALVPSAVVDGDLVARRLAQPDAAFVVFRFAAERDLP